MLWDIYQNAPEAIIVASAVFDLLVTRFLVRILPVLWRKSINCLRAFFK